MAVRIALAAALLAVVAADFQQLHRMPIRNFSKHVVRSNQDADSVQMRTLLQQARTLEADLEALVKIAGHDAHGDHRGNTAGLHTKPKLAAHKADMEEEGECNLKMYERKAHTAIGYLDRAMRADLADVPDGTGASLQLKCARHHVVPLNVLKDFWNAVVIECGSGDVDGTLKAALGQFMVTLATNAQHYTIPDDEKKALLHFIQLVNPEGDATPVQFTIDADGKIPYPDDSVTDDAACLAFEITFEPLYNYLPGNVFIGPEGQERGDDPGEHFEAGCAGIMAQFDTLQRMNADMVAFNAAPAGSIEKGVTALQLYGEVSGLDTEYTPLDPNQWETVSGKKGKVKWVIKTV